MCRGRACGTLSVPAHYVDGVYLYLYPASFASVRCGFCGSVQPRNDVWVHVLAARRACRPGRTAVPALRVNALSMASWHHEGRRQAATQALTAWTLLHPIAERRRSWWAGSHREGCGMTGGQEKGMPRAGDVSDLPEGGGGRIRLRIAVIGTWTTRAWERGDCLGSLAVALVSGSAWPPEKPDPGARPETKRCRGRWATVWGGFALLRPVPWGVSAS
ncbi:hypothetical protein V8C26DRAFT_404830 [Trichoderma gracile]